MSEEFIREVDEEIKEERQMQLWKKLAPYFIALASAIILITISIVGWQTYSKKQKESLGDDFSAAVELIQEQDTDAALLALEKVASSSSDGYITLAKMKQASILISDGKIDAIGSSPNKIVERLNASGCMVLPGIVDLHGDAFERQIMIQIPELLLQDFVYYQNS